MPKIVILHQSGPRKGEREVFATQLYSSVFLGRSDDCDVKLDDPERVVSRTHALIEWDDASDTPLSITDLHSSNGTYVNGKRVEGTVALNNGDAVQLGLKLGPVIRVAVVRPKDEEGEETVDPLASRHTTFPEARDPEREAARAARPAKGTRTLAPDEDL